MITSDVQNDGLIELSGTLAFRDLLNFQYSQRYRRTWWLILPMMPIALGGFLLVVMAAWLTSDLQLALNNGTPFLLALAFWLLIAMSPYWGAKRLLKSSIQLSAPITYTFSNQGIHSTGVHSSSDISYEALWAVRETKSLLLLYLNAASAIVLPKRIFRDDIQQDAWRLLVEQRISPKRIAKSGLLGRWL